MSGPLGDEFAIQLVPDFNERVQKIPIRERSSVYSGIIWKLRRDPTFDAFNLEANLWFANIESVPSFFVFYTVDFETRVVVLTDVRRLT